MRIRHNGNIGVGTSTPVSKLNIAGGSASWGESAQGLAVGSIHLDPENTASHYGNAITFGASDSGSGETAQAGIYTRSDGSYGTKMYFSTTNSYAAGSRTRMMIDHNGNVGVGTTSPSTKLDVDNSVLEESFKLTTGTDGRILTFRGETINFKRAGSNYIAASNSSGALNFSTGGSDIYNSQIRLRIAPSGNVGIGTTSPSHKLEVNGTIRSKEVKVEATNWPDYVFEPTYDLRSLEEIEQYIQSNKHLPEIPSAKEMEANGVQLGEMNMLLLKKIEELTLHTIAQEKKIQKQGELEKKIEEMTLKQMEMMKLLTDQQLIITELRKKN